MPGRTRFLLENLKDHSHNGDIDHKNISKVNFDPRIRDSVCKFECPSDKTNVLLILTKDEAKVVNFHNHHSQDQANTIPSLSLCGTQTLHQIRITFRFREFHENLTKQLLSNTIFDFLVNRI
jgi:hypothetical protein